MNKQEKKITTYLNRAQADIDSWSKQHTKISDIGYRDTIWLTPARVHNEQTTLCMHCPVTVSKSISRAGHHCGDYRWIHVRSCPESASTNRSLLHAVAAWWRCWCYQRDRTATTCTPVSCSQPVMGRRICCASGSQAFPGWCIISYNCHARPHQLSFTSHLQATVVI